MGIEQELRRVPDWPMVRVVVEWNGGSFEPTLECGSCLEPFDLSPSGRSLFECPDCGFELTGEIGNAVLEQALSSIKRRTRKAGLWARVKRFLRRLVGR